MHTTLRRIALFVLAVFSLQAAVVPVGMACPMSGHAAHATQAAESVADSSPCHAPRDTTAAPSIQQDDDHGRIAGQCAHDCSPSCWQGCHSFAGFLVHASSAEVHFEAVTVVPSSDGAILPPHCNVPLRPPAAIHA